MKIVTDESNVITAILYVGSMDGAVEVTDPPADLDVLRYKYVDGDFVINSDYSDTSYVDLETEKTSKINDSKSALAEWFLLHPYQHTDGKYYSCTEEKQSLLNGNLASCERAKQAGIEYPLKWNSTGEECVAWEYNDLLTLSLMMAAYVAPKVSAQQSFEVQIRNAATKDELDAIVINYD